MYNSCLKDFNIIKIYSRRMFKIQEIIQLLISDLLECQNYYNINGSLFYQKLFENRELYELL